MLRGCWIMRQSGRYLSSYQQLKRTLSFEQLCKTPKLAARCASLPLEEFSGLLDYAILFSDILFVLEPLGFKVNFSPSTSAPIVERSAPLEQVPTAVSNEHFIASLHWIFEAIRETLNTVSVPLLAFAGSPLALLCFIVEGRSGASGCWKKSKQFLQSHPQLAIQWLEMLTDKIIVLLKHELNNYPIAGVQVFDSTCFDMDLHLWERFSWPYLERIAASLSPTASDQKLFIYSRCPALGIKRLLAQSAFDVVSVDERLDLIELVGFMRRFGICKILQGPFDPSLLFASNEEISQRVRGICEMFDEASIPFIVNLSNGIVPEAREEKVRFFLSCVQDQRNQ